jgi:hypothetical protein
MNNAKHTPGEWYSRNSGPDSHNQAMIASEATGATVAIVYDRKDAPLLAAAPDLLTALRDVVSAFDRLKETNAAKWYLDTSCTFTGAEWLHGNGNGNAIRAARAAIRKATGEE